MTKSSACLAINYDILCWINPLFYFGNLSKLTRYERAYIEAHKPKCVATLLGNRESDFKTQP